MDIKLDQRMLQKCYDYYNDEIKALESKKVQVLTSGNVFSHQLAKRIDWQIIKMQEELEAIKYYML